MGKPDFSDDFKRDAVAQITVRGYRVAEVSERLGVSPHSLYAWKRQLAQVVSGDGGKDAQEAHHLPHPHPRTFFILHLGPPSPVPSISKVIEIVAPPLRHHHSFGPIRRLVVDAPYLARYGMGQCALDGLGIPLAAFVQQRRCRCTKAVGRHLLFRVSHSAQGSCVGIFRNRPFSRPNRGGRHICPCRCSRIPEDPTGKRAEPFRGFEPPSLLVASNFVEQFRRSDLCYRPACSPRCEPAAWRHSDRCYEPAAFAPRPAPIGPLPE